MYLYFDSVAAGEACLSNASAYMPMSGDYINSFTGPCVIIPEY